MNQPNILSRSTEKHKKKSAGKGGKRARGLPSFGLVPSALGWESAEGGEKGADTWDCSIRKIAEKWAA